MGEQRPRAQPERVTESYAIGTWKRLIVWVVEGHTPLEELERLRHLAVDRMAKVDGDTVSLIVLYSARTTMSSAERRSVVKMIDQTKHSRAASSTVVLGRGLLGALHRSILTGMSLIAPPPHPVKICADVPTAIAFLHPYIETACGPVHPVHVEAMVNDLYGDLCSQKLLADAG